MTYDKLIETISEILTNDKIQKNGLTLLYTLSERDHNYINELLYRKANPYAVEFEPTDEFEVVVEGILVKFKKNSENA
jgi:hypothetical protein